MTASPTAAIQTFLNVPPLAIFVKGEARKGAYQLKCNGNWRHQDLRGHSRITSIITDPVLDMGSDHRIPKYSFEKMFDIQIDWKEWSQEENHRPSNSLIWYADASRTNSGAGA
jgi:hypothetical protein